jgi:hypothetical protein
MAKFRKQFQVGIGLAAVLLIFIGSGCNSSESVQKDTAIGVAARITVFYPEHFEDSINDIFTQTKWAADSNLIRFEENLPQSDPGYYEALFEFELHSFSQMEEEDISTGNNLRSAPLVWILDPKGKFEDLTQSSQKNTEHPKVILKDTIINQIECTWISNVWSFPQIVLIIHDTHSSGENLNSLWFQSNQQILLHLTKRFELQNTQTNKTGNHHPCLVQNRYSDSISGAIEANYSIKPVLSAELKLVSKANDFLWLRQETNNYHSNVMFQFIPMTDSMLNQKNVRNELTKKYLRTAEGTWAEISESGQFPIRQWQVKGIYGTEYWMSGWQTELNTNRRGPFLRRLLRDQANHRYIAVDGFIFAPNQPRNRLMRELEIMVSQCSLSQ